MAEDASNPMHKSLVLERRFQAPRALVWKAWTDPALLAVWWGPRGFTNPVCKVDPRVGGAMEIVMRAPDGSDYPMRCQFTAVEPPKRLLFTNQALTLDGQVVLDGWTEVVFSEAGEATDLKITTEMKAMIPQAAAYLTGMDEGWSGSLDKLAETFG